MREVVGRREGKKQEAQDRLEQESKEKYLTGIKCPDRVCGRLDSAERAAFPFVKKRCTSVRGESGTSNNY